MSTYKEEDVIILLDDDDDDENNIEKGQQNILKSSRKTKNLCAKRPTPSEIIIIDDDDDDANDNGVKNPTKRRKKRGNKNNGGDDDDDAEVFDITDDVCPVKCKFDDVEIVHAPEASPIERFESTETPTTITTSTKQKRKVCKKTKTTTKLKGEPEDDVVALGRANVQRLPHLRQHCSDFPFIQDVKNRRSRKKWETNKKHCPFCYCYVCDAPIVPDCNDWDGHCLASDKGKFSDKWKSLRESSKKKPDDVSTFSMNLSLLNASDWSLSSFSD